jgi:diguanylate cyclase (GGDEF)-like protein
VSFRTRLAIFFLLIVVLPMIAIAVLVVSITNDSRSGKADARLGEGLVTARSFYTDHFQDSRKVARLIAADPRLGAALQSGSTHRVQAVAQTLADQQGVDSLVIQSPAGKPVASIGPQPIASGSVMLRTASGADAGKLTASTTSPKAFLSQVRQRTGLDAALSGGAAPIASTVSLGSEQLPAPGTGRDITVGGSDLRAATLLLPGGSGQRLTVLGPAPSKGFFSKQPLVGATLAVFFLIALAFALGILRALGGQVRVMLEGAKRIGGGDFSGEVPVVGKDEMAGLASEFNLMRQRLATQVAELQKQRTEIERSTHRIGEAFASGLDREALLDIVLETSLSACHADYGIIALGGSAGGEVERGTPTSELRDAVLGAEERSTREGRMVDTTEHGVVVLSSPLEISGEPARHGGVMSVARVGEPFDVAERDIFGYLLGQISASIENVALHEMVSQQAITDDLTGLANKRRFRDLLAKEAARAKRFGHEVSLLMLDLDDFKKINDTYGHLQGDEVLRRVARSLDAESRGFDEPCRYGGEEFAIALPETGMQGALDLAERVRSRIAAQLVEKLDGPGTITVTASIGAATTRGGAEEVDALVAAADAALYRAKAAGKDRIASADESGAPSA